MRSKLAHAEYTHDTHTTQLAPTQCVTMCRVVADTTQYTKRTAQRAPQRGVADLVAPCNLVPDIKYLHIFTRGERKIPKNNNAYTRIVARIYAVCKKICRCQSKSGNECKIESERACCF